MTAIIEFVTDKVQGWMRVARESYSVDPIVFVVLLAACAPFFYFSIYRLVRGMAKKEARSITLWSSVFLGSTVLPYLYVLVFGRGMPWWIYILIGLLVAQGVYTLVKKLRAGPAGSRSAGGGLLAAGARPGAAGSEPAAMAVSAAVPALAEPEPAARPTGPARPPRDSGQSPSPGSG